MNFIVITALVRVIIPIGRIDGMKIYVNVYWMDHGILSAYYMRTAEQQFEL